MARHARRRRPSTIGLVAMTLLAVAAGALASEAESRWPVNGPFVRAGAVGTALDVEPVRVTVHGVRAATVLSDGLDDLDSAGIWIAVDVSAAALTEPATIAEMALRAADGREFRQTDRAPNPMVGGEFDPLITERGEVVFEVPGDVVGEVVLVISPDAPRRTVPRAAAEVPLTVEAPGPDPLVPRARELATEDP
ncbi:hypothetical protein [Jiangella asiatica]|uniref:DUF4352 domain-containing protein n=1 Tax=Jiangella asiatica TaxID=2530372 RepID=A0A4R5D9Q8_9ACTN|nr:hypothetical protein [Jiangella asiatica]TDE09507.1 hypothetical protein E1269_14430 [Jiangella asiatica]